MIPGVHIASSEMVIRQEPGKPLSGPALKNNQVVRAMVLNLSPPNEAELMIDGKKISVKTRVPLRPGEHLQLKVAAQKDGFLLKLMGPSDTPGQKTVTALLQSLSQGLSKGTALKDIFRANTPELNRIMDQISLKSPDRDNNFLPKLLEKGGMLWENKLSAMLKTGGPDALARQMDQLAAQDFKGTALRQAALAAQAGSSESGQAGGTNPAQTVESLQLLNSLSSESGRFLLPFPVLTGVGFNLGQLLIDLGEGGTAGEKDKIIRLSFLLDMTRLGGVRADFSVLNKAITGCFLLQDPDTCDFVSGMIPELKERFENLSYRVHRIDCSVAEPADTHPDTFMESLFKGREDQVLNIVI